MNRPDDHSFLASPHRTLGAMALPLLLSLVAEPVTGLVDTAFVSRLGSASLAAVGVGTTALTSLFWTFNFLGVGSQTLVAKAVGSGDSGRIQDTTSLAVGLAVVLGICLICIIWPFGSKIAFLMGAEGEVHAQAVSYLRIRLLGAPAVLITIAGFGILRGLMDMAGPLKISLALNLVNIFLDWGLIFGNGPFPRMGIAGAALATAISQWLGAAGCIHAVSVRAGFSKTVRPMDALTLIQIARDLFIRTGVLNLFLLVTTRAATLMGPDAGAAHQALRQFWIFTALFLDAYAIAGQSLAGYFTGCRRPDLVRRVARVVCFWSIIAGVLLSSGMVFGAQAIAQLLVPAAAVDIFLPAWTIAAVFQPLNAVAFGTDGIHWGIGDFQYLRNVMVAASVLAAWAVLLLDTDAPGGLVWIWGITGAWVSVRAAFGFLRIWPGIGHPPLDPRS